MVFPFTFSFSVPGLFNPFRASSSSANPPAPKISDHSEVFRNQFRAHQTPTSEHCHRRSQELESGYRVNTPAPAYPSSSSYPIPIPSTNPGGRRISRSQLPKIPRRHSPSPSPSSLRALPISRKRGWEPAFGVESIQSLTSNGKSSSTTSLTFVSSSGYLDTPAKYREMAEDITMSDSGYRENDAQHDEDAPPMKKRRGLAGSIVSTAVSAALIGTAVGLTVYRLWRDRGKEAQIASGSESQQQEQDPDKQIPPPPYDAGHWPVTSPSAPAPASASSSIPHSQSQAQQRTVPGTQSPATPRANANGKGRRVGGAKKTVVAPRHHQNHSARRTRNNNTHTPRQGGVGSPRARSEFDFGQAPGGEEGRQTEVEDKMDWLGDKMALLIEQGRRALQSEVVVMSEAKEDEVDDGRGGWEEEDEDEVDGSDLDDQYPYGRARAGSVRGSSSSSLQTQTQTRRQKTRPRDIAVPLPNSSSSSPAKVGLGLYGVHTSAPSSSSLSYPSGSLSSSPRRSGFSSSSYSYPYGTPTLATSYTTPAHASAGFVSSSNLNLNLSVHGSPGRAHGYGHVRGISYESALPAFASPSGGGGGGGGGGASEGWESPEIREGMERARARLLARRNGV